MSTPEGSEARTTVTTYAAYRGEYRTSVIVTTAVYATTAKYAAKCDKCYARLEGSKVPSPKFTERVFGRRFAEVALGPERGHAHELATEAYRELKHSYSCPFMMWLREQTDGVGPLVFKRQLVVGNAIF